MSRRVYRVCRSTYAQLDGAGAKRAGGRWNSPGRAVVYMTQSVSLAVLENLVHMERVDFPEGFVVVSAIIPDEVRVIRLRSSNPREDGDRWIDSLSSAVLEVPSVIVPAEYNYLLNPLHPDFSKVVVEEIAPFIFDRRLFGGS